MKLEQINYKHQIQTGVSPTKADVAFASIDINGNIGTLNEYVTQEYKYSLNDLPKSRQLSKLGYGLLTGKGNKPIIYVVTVDSRRDSSVLLKANLLKALVECRNWFQNKIVWLPLMGTGTGGLTYEESYSITTRVINNFQNSFPTEVEFLISLPDTPTANQFLKKLPKPTPGHNKDLEDLIQNRNCNYYLAGAYWSGDDQVNRFFQEGIWEKGQEDDSYSEIINGIKVNDIIILKSAFSLSQESVLRVKGIGIVTKESSDGAAIQVDWKIKNITFDVSELGKYRRTIAKAEYEDVHTIFQSLDPEVYNLVLNPIIVHPSTQEKIAGLVSDSEKGTDLLNIEKDVRAFARVVAARSVEPPLAIALFGKWGSGKSFFMRMLKEQIGNLSSQAGNTSYCEGIVQIHFNAWSYMDANLWASFVSKIFEGLNEYITENSKSQEAKNEIEKKLCTTLNITKEEISILDEKKKVIENQIKSLTQKEVDLNEEIKKKIKEIEQETIYSVLSKIESEFQAKEKIINALNQNQTYLQSEAELKEIVPEQYWNNPNEAYQQIKSTSAFLKEFFRYDRYKRNLFWVTAIILLIAFAPTIINLLTEKLKQTNFLLPQSVLTILVIAGSAWRRAMTVYTKFQPIIASFWNIKEEYEETKEKALADYELKKTILKRELEKKKEELAVISTQKLNAENLKAELEFKISKTLATEALYSFIEKRSKSEDYKKYLGIISTIRKDFEILNGLFSDHHQEVITLKNKSDFQNLFKKPLQRIILYIDDLDRCPEDNVVQVLEAVNLLMAFPLFVVIVGVDPRWVKNALIKKYSLHFAGRVNDSSYVDGGIELIEPSNYLEKIFQVPFHLKDATVITVREMIKKLATTKPQLNTNTPKDLPTEDMPEMPTPLPNIIPPEPSGTKEIPQINPQSIDLNAFKQDSIELLELANDEVSIMEDMGEIIGPNPRAVKRFVNIFRIIKAHEEFTVNQQSSNDDRLAVLFLLALSLGQYKKLATSFEEYFESDSNRDKQVTFYFQPTYKVNNLQEMKQELNVLLSDNLNYNRIHKIKTVVFKTHNAFIRRFSFKNI